MDIGSELRRARNARKLSLDDIARATKISHSVLRALEGNAFHDVPGGLFTRGYLRAYAGLVGLDPEALVQAYLAEFEPPVPAGPDPKDGSADSPHDAVAWNSEQQDNRSRHSEILQFVVILVVALVYLASLRSAKPAAADTELQAAETVVALAPPADPADATPVGTSGSIPTAQRPLGLEIHPTGPCWVDVTVDGKHSLGRLLNPGDRETVTIGENLTLRVGDPAAFAFSIDGAPGRSLGPEGRPVTVQINRANYRTLLGGRQGG